MFITIEWDTGEHIQKAVVSDPDAAFSLCWALDKAYQACKWWTLVGVPENSFVWYHRQNFWEKVRLDQ